VRIINVRVQSAPADGISMRGSLGVIARSTVRARIDVAGNGNRVTDNVIAGALDAGIAIVSGSGNVVARNWAVDTEPVFAGDDSTGDGIHVGAFTAGTVVRENIAVRNGDDGIDLDSSGARVVRNLANDNGDLGIDARPGTSAAGNIAHGNGNPAQCAGIVCG
jgi:parallel beta-helix repeat protein